MRRRKSQARARILVDFDGLKGRSGLVLHKTTTHVELEIDGRRISFTRKEVQLRPAR